MIFRKVFTSFIIIGLAAEVWSHIEIEAEEYFFPLDAVIDYCLLAEQCQHDFVAVCGQNSEGVSRMFKDNCDLYEYDCDEKKQFKHVEMAVCDFQNSQN